MKRPVMCLVVMLVLVLLPPAVGSSGPGPMTWLDQPIDGTEIPFPLTSDSITVQAHASDADGIATFEFFVDGETLGSLPVRGGRLGEASVEWTPLEAGTYTISARATDSQGNAGSEASSTVIVGRVESPTPTALPTPSEPPPVQADEIEIDFTADRTRLQPGECAVLEWSVRRAVTESRPDDFHIELALNEEPVEQSGERRVCPRVTTSYSLVAHAGDGPPDTPAAVRRIEIVVAEIPLVVPTATASRPTERSPEDVDIRFAADRTGLQPEECAVLEWEVRGGFGVTLNGQVVERSGEERVCPPETTSYVLAVDAGVRLESEELVISVAGEPEPPEAEEMEISANIWTNPDAITRGECAVLGWEVGPAGEWGVLLDGQQVATSGSQQVCPTSTKTYELLVEAPGGNVVRFATLSVSEGPGEQSQPGQPEGGADVRPSDLFAQTGTVWTRITNDGHDTLSGDKVEVTLSGCGAARQYALSIAPGQTQTIDTGCQAATGSNSYTVSVKAVDFTDPNPNNNSYSETIDWGGAPPPAQPTPSTGPSQPAAADLAITDLFPQTLHGPVFGRITNRGPAGVSNLTVQFSCRWTESDPIEGIQKSNQVGPRNITITSLSAGQTTEFSTNISVEIGQFQYDMTCTLHGPANDPNTGNNSYSEKF